jgi:hypothetical protein
VSVWSTRSRRAATPGEHAAAIEVRIGRREDGDGQQDDQAAHDADDRQHGCRGPLRDRRGDLSLLAVAHQALGPLVSRQRILDALGKRDQRLPQLVELPEELRHHRHADHAEKGQCQDQHHQEGPAMRQRRPAFHRPRKAVQPYGQQQAGETSRRTSPAIQTNRPSSAVSSTVVGAQPTPADVGAAARRIGEWDGSGIRGGVH